MRISFKRRSLCQPKKSNSASTPATGCCAALKFSTTRSRSRSAPRAATSCSTNRSALPASPRTASPSPRKSSLTTSSRTWARRWCAKSPPSRPTRPASARHSRRAEAAGAGTPTATVLAAAIVREGAKSVAAGMNPMDLKRGIDMAVAAIVGELKKKSKKATPNHEIAQVGTISANGDAEIGRFLAEAMKKVGNEGVITVEEAKSLETELDVVEGMQFDRGYISPYFVTNADKMRVEMEDPYILINEKKLSG